ARRDVSAFGKRRRVSVCARAPAAAPPVKGRDGVARRILFTMASTCIHVRNSPRTGPSGKGREAFRPVAETDSNGLVHRQGCCAGGQKIPCRARIRADNHIPGMWHRLQIVVVFLLPVALVGGLYLFGLTLPVPVLGRDYVVRLDLPQAGERV